MPIPRAPVVRSKATVYYVCHYQMATKNRHTDLINEIAHQQQCTTALAETIYKKAYRNIVDVYSVGGRCYIWKSLDINCLEDIESNDELTEKDLNSAFDDYDNFETWAETHGLEENVLQELVRLLPMQLQKHTKQGFKAAILKRCAKYNKQGMALLQNCIEKLLEIVDNAVEPSQQSYIDNCIVQLIREYNIERKSRSHDRLKFTLDILRGGTE